MLVANSFDSWQKDAFFSAAEEVQESADTLESAYRTWLREKREGIPSSDLDELQRELQTALGTAKWQLEEFERAVRLSYGNCQDHNRITRHQEFIVAIGSQISQVEDMLRRSLDEEGKHPLQWVNLDEDERDDLALFLSGSTETSRKCTRDEFVKPAISSISETLPKKKYFDYAACSSGSSMEANIHTEGLTSVKNDMVISAVENLGKTRDVGCEVDKTSSTKRTRVSPKSGLLKVVIPNQDGEMRITMPTIEATPKEKGFRTSSFLYLRLINCISKLFKCSNGLKSRMQGPQRLQFSSSMRLIIFLTISFFLLVPYFLHSS